MPVTATLKKTVSIDYPKRNERVSCTRRFVVELAAPREAVCS